MIKDNVSNFKRLLNGKAFAYNRVFDRNNQFTTDVLKDLSRFCRAHVSAYHPDPRIHAMLEGRREVWLRIQEYLELDIDEIYSLHKIKEIQPEKESPYEQSEERR